jgi:hypothetical protein
LFQIPNETQSNRGEGEAIDYTIPSFGLAEGRIGGSGGVVEGVDRNASLLLHLIALIYMQVPT